MKSVAVHIGYHKTASTYLQTSVFPRLEANYVFVAGPQRAYLELIQSRNQYAPEKFRQWVSAQVEAQGKGRHYDLTILSHEELSGHPHGYKQIDPFVVADNLMRTYPAAKVILVVRNQFDYLRSLYTFRVAIKGQEYRRFERFLNEEGQLGLFDKLEYHQLAGYYVSLYGQENVLILPMELLGDSAVPFNQVITDFLDVPPIPTLGDKIVNPSTNLASVVHFWRPLNYLFAAFIALLGSLGIEPEEAYPYERLRYAYYALKRRGTRLLATLLRFTPEVDPSSYSGYPDLQKRYIESNRQLQQYVPVDLFAYGYPYAVEGHQPGAQPTR
jgi:hypothetical protein